MDGLSLNNIFSYMECWFVWMILYDPCGTYVNMWLLACLVLHESVNWLNNHNPYKLDFLTSYSNDPRFWVKVFLKSTRFSWIGMPPPRMPGLRNVGSKGSFKLGSPQKGGPFFLAIPRLYGKVGLHLTTNICTHRIPCMVFLSTWSFSIKHQQNVGK